MTHTLRRSDADLKSAVIDELDWTPGVDGTHIGVAVDSGAVTLSGEVTSYPEKLLAATAVQRVRGVTAVAQEITVRTPWSVSDSDGAREAGEALERAVDVPDTVTATVHDHVITLAGTVNGNYQRIAAARAVRHAKGITGVVNMIMIRPVALASGVKAAITSALVRNARLESTHITVTADGGVATLEGTVRSWAERNDAAQACWAAPGVVDVIDNLTIRY